MMWFRAHRFISGLIVVFALYYFFTNPEGAANLVQSAFNAIGSAFEKVSTFMNKVSS